jgi:hypothetical protein
MLILGVPEAVLDRGESIGGREVECIGSLGLNPGLSSWDDGSWLKTRGSAGLPSEEDDGGAKSALIIADV